MSEDAALASVYTHYRFSSSIFSGYGLNIFPVKQIARIFLATMYVLVRRTTYIAPRTITFINNTFRLILTVYICRI